MSNNQTVTVVLRIAAVVTFIIGLTTLLAPAEIVRIFDGFDPGNYHFVRFIGTALIGFAVTNWLYSFFTDITVVLPAIYGNIASLILATIVDFVGLLTGVLTSPAWLILMLHLIFLTAFLYTTRLIHRAALA